MGLRLKPFLTALLLAFLAVSAPAFPQDSGWFIGAGGGGTKFENGCSTFTGPGSCDDNGIFWKVFGGYQFASWFGFEVGYADFGKSEQTATGVGSSTIEANGAEAVLVLTMPFTQGFGIYGKYGIYRWNVEKVVTGPSPLSVDTSGTDITYGFGIKYDWTKNLALRLEWQRYQNMGDAFTGDFDVDAGLFGIVFKF